MLRHPCPRSPNATPPENSILPARNAAPTLGTPQAESPAASDARSETLPIRANARRRTRLRSEFAPRSLRNRHRRTKQRATPHRLHRTCTEPLISALIGLHDADDRPTQHRPQRTDAEPLREAQADHLSPTPVEASGMPKSAELSFSTPHGRLVEPHTVPPDKRGPLLLDSEYASEQWTPLAGDRTPAGHGQQCFSK
jgi:hypothetical protein